MKVWNQDTKSVSLMVFKFWGKLVLIVQWNKCNFCGKIFASQSEFLTHRKHYHKQIVPPFLNVQNGKCQYTNENCWFNQNENEIIDENENNDTEIEENKEVIQKIF